MLIITNYKYLIHFISNIYKLIIIILIVFYINFTYFIAKYNNFFILIKYYYIKFLKCKNLLKNLQ